MMALDTSNYWVILGIVLMVSEMLSGGFFMIFIAFGCFGASLVAALAQPLGLQLATCALLTVVGIAALRRILKRKFLKSLAISGDVGQEINIDQDIHPHKRARITYQGTTWEATNIGAEEISRGDRAVIVGMDGIALLVRKVK